MADTLTGDVAHSQGDIQPGGTNAAVPVMYGQYLFGLTRNYAIPGGRNV